jgi:hypothetical protein
MILGQLGTPMATPSYPTPPKQPSAARTAAPVPGFFFRNVAGQGRSVTEKETAQTLGGVSSSQDGDTAGSGLRQLTQRCVKSASSGSYGVVQGQPTSTDIPESTNVQKQPNLLQQFTKSTTGTKLGVERIRGFFRSAEVATNYLVVYGIPDDPLVEIVPARAIGNLVLELLPERPCLADIQNQVASKTWNHNCELTNVALSASVRRPTIWV